MNNMIKCATCNEEIAKNAKVCPKCGAKVKKPFYKKAWFWIIIVLVLMVAVNSGKDNDEASTKKPNVKENTPVEYTNVEISTLEADLDSNAALAKDNYNNTYVEFTGYLSNVDSDLKYISVSGSTDSWDFFTIHCSIKKEEQKDVIKTLSKGQSVTVKGKITDVGEVLGYYLDINEISGN